MASGPPPAVASSARSDDGIGCESSYGYDDSYDSGGYDSGDYSGGDLDCADFPDTDFPVQPGDPYGLDGDGDGDGIACES